MNSYADIELARRRRARGIRELDRMDSEYYNTIYPVQTVKLSDEEIEAILHSARSNPHNYTRKGQGIFKGQRRAVKP